VSVDPATIGAGPGSLAKPAAAAAGGAPANDADRQRIVEAAQQFEAMFLLQMLKQMRQSMLSEEDQAPGLGAGTMLDTIDAELSKYLAGQRGGLTPMLVDVMTKARGNAAAAGVSTSLESPSMAIPARIAPEAAAAMLPARSAAAAWPSGPAPATAAAMVPGGNPYPGTVTSGFGWRKDPFTGASRFHAGVDIRASYGRDVESVGPGRVVSAGVQGGYGKSVVIEHAPGLRTRYAHLSSIDVAVGDAVGEGAVIGKVGQSGRATGPHLHFEVLKNGRAVNPKAGGRLLAAEYKEPAAAADYPTGSAGLYPGMPGAEQ
jgi:murein DD-endopeptidase MepM/ murein hydrolase activator NlpD